MINKELIKKEYAFMGDVIYLNISLTSMPPMRVQTAFKGFMDGYVSTFAANQEEYFHEIIDYTRSEMAKLLDCDTSEVAFARSTSDGLTALANSFPFNPGDNVVLTAEEHASNVVPWLALEKKGVEIRFAPSSNGCVAIEDIVKTMDEHTRIVSTASTYFCSGYAIDLAALSAECRKVGAYLAIDGIQSMGRLAIHPHKLGVDYITGGSYKGLLGTKGSGFIYCSKELLDILDPYTGSQQGLTNGGRPFPLRHYADIEWQKDARKLEHGNYNYVVMQSMANGVSLINELGIQEIDTYIHGLEQLLRDKIAHLDLKMVTPPEKNRSGLLFVYYPQHAEAEDVRRILLDYNIQATIRHGYIRMGLNFYNTEEHMERIAQALEDISKL